MKYRNTILASAIGTALSMGTAFADVQLTKVQDGDTFSKSDYTRNGEWDGHNILRHPSTGEAIVYATELFGGDSSPILPGCNESSTDFMAVEYEVSIDNLPGIADITFTLTGADFQAAHLGIYDNANGSVDPVTGEPLGGPWMGEGGNLPTGTVNGNEVTFTINPDGGTDAAPEAYKLHQGSRIALLYQLENVALSEENSEVKLTARVEGDFGREITIASAENAFDIDITPTTPSTTRVSVSDSSTVFADTSGDLAPDDAWVSELEARIGWLSVTENDPVNILSCDNVGLTFGEGSIAAISSSESTLEFITEGQLSASGFANSVQIRGSDNITVSTLEEANIDVTTGSAIISIDSLENLTYGIYLQVDGETEIRVPEDNPTVALSLFFDDILGPIFIEDGELARIRKDGTICRILNVPNTSAQDKFNLRLTNNSGLEGSMSAVLYGMDGSILASGPLHPVGEDPEIWKLQPKQTIRLSAEDLETIFNIGAWDRRATMEINSEIKDLEALVLLRHVDPGSPLTNLSLGAMGESCKND